MPYKFSRVVWAFGETAVIYQIYIKISHEINKLIRHLVVLIIYYIILLTFAPTILLTRVDFPAFGAPITAMFNDLGLSGCSGDFMGSIF